MSDTLKTPEADLIDSKEAVTGSGSIDKAITGDYEFTISTIIKEGWQKTKGAKWAIHLAFFLYFLVAIAFLILAQVAMATFIKGTNSPDLLLAFTIGQQLLLNLILLPIIIGIFILGIKRSVNAPLESTSIFDYFNKMGQLLITMILVYILIAIGFVLLIVPGIYLSVAYFMAMPLVVEKGLSPWQAMEVSRKAITKRWFSFFFLGLLLGLILLVSTIPFGLGLIWTMPMMFICYGVVYRNMFGVEDQTLV